MSSWTELYHRHALPKAATLDMARSLDERMRGRHLDRISADLANRLLGLIESERANRQRVDWQLRDQLLQSGTRATASPRRAEPGTASRTSPARPGVAAPTARPAPPSGGPGAPAAGVGLRRSSFDGRTATPADLKSRIEMLGCDASWYVTTNCNEQAREMAKAPSLGLTLKADRAAREAAARQEKRAADLKAGALDARDAPVAQVRERLAKLGISHDLQASIREGGKPLPLPERGPDPLAAALEARRRAERRARQALKEKRPVDTKRMDDATFAAYLKLRGFAGGW